MTKTITDYEKDICNLHADLIEIPEYHPDYEKTASKLSRKMKSWSNLLSISVQVASNEQTPWSSKELGHPTIPMATKKDSDVRQVGDYVAYIDYYDKFCGLLVERKGVTRKNGRMVGCDLYSSFSNTDNRRRFYAEIERYKTDPRFNQMVLIAECSLGEYLAFKPTFNGKNYNKTNPGMNGPARRATIAKLHAMGCPVLFAGTRHHAVDMYHDLIIQWCRTNYHNICGVE